jgi:hypothetical protein
MSKVLTNAQRSIFKAHPISRAHCESLTFAFFPARSSVDWTSWPLVIKGHQFDSTGRDQKDQRAVKLSIVHFAKVGLPFARNYDFAVKFGIGLTVFALLFPLTLSFSAL